MTRATSHFLDTVRWQFRVAWSFANDVHLPRLLSWVNLELMKSVAEIGIAINAATAAPGREV